MFFIYFILFFLSVRSSVPDSDGDYQDKQRRRILEHLAPQLPESSAAMTRVTRSSPYGWVGNTGWRLGFGWKRERGGGGGGVLI